MAAATSARVRAMNDKIMAAINTGPAMKKPWVILSPVRNHLERELELPGPVLMRELVRGKSF